MGDGCVVDLQSCRVQCLFLSLRFEVNWGFGSVRAPYIFCHSLIQRQNYSANAETDRKKYGRKGTRAFPRAKDKRMHVKTFRGAEEPKRTARYVEATWLRDAYFLILKSASLWDVAHSHRIQSDCFAIKPSTPISNLEQTQWIYMLRRRAAISSFRSIAVSMSQ